MGNINAWEEVFADNHKILCVLYLDCSLDICMKRLIKRSETSNRSDDEVEIIKKRFVTFQEENKPILDHMEKVSKVIKVDSSGSHEEIFNVICTEIKDLLK